ncbi:MAG: hypothetical protein ACRDN9_06745 [Streptosporangiaceae bacterium]
MTLATEKTRLVSPPPESPTKRARAVARRVLCLLGGFVLFVAALQLMKSGASALEPALSGSAFTDNAWSTLGLGWLGSCLVLSGSPIAASALSLLDGGAINWTDAFTMITGSRLGAAFVVLVAGTIYALRHTARGGRRPPLSIGVVALFVTAVAYVPAAAIGFGLLKVGALGTVAVSGPGTPGVAFSLTDAALGWVAPLAGSVLPGPLLFPLGVAVLLLGFRVFDGGMPRVKGDRFAGHTDAWFTRKWAMFGLGCLVCLLTLSVSVSLTVLVPLVARRHLRLKDTIPYVAGANITTLADTFVAAGVLGNQHAIQVVAAITVAVAVWTLTLLVAAYPLLQRACLRVAALVLASRKTLLACCVALLGVPLVLIAV